MRILLINPPIREEYQAYQEPIGLMSVGTALSRAGHQVALMDINCHRLPWERLAEALPRGAYDMVGLSGIISTYKFAAHAVPILRKVYPDVPIVIGGGGLTSAPDTYMTYIRPDFGVIGEGEVTAVELANALETGKSTRGMSGLTYFEGDDLRYGPPRPLVEDINTFYPLDWGSIDVEAYAGFAKHFPGQRELSILATRGCPMACNFCYHIFGRSFRWRAPDQVVAEMKMLRDKWAVMAFMMTDECITANPQYLKDFCELLIQADLGVVWSSFSRVDTIDPNMMCLMRDAGCDMIGFGMENGSQRILDAMNKKVTTGQMHNTFNYARRIFRRVSSTWIFGYPGMDDEAIAENIRFMADLDIVHDYFHLQPYPGTKVFEENKEKILAQFGTLDAFFRELDNAGKFIINLTDWSDAEYKAKHRAMLKRICLNHMYRHLPTGLVRAVDN